MREGNNLISRQQSPHTFPSKNNLLNPIWEIGLHWPYTFHTAHFKIYYHCAVLKEKKSGYSQPNNLIYTPLKKIVQNPMYANGSRGSQVTRWPLWQRKNCLVKRVAKYSVEVTNSDCISARLTPPRRHLSLAPFATKNSFVLIIGKSMSSAT